MSLRTVYQLSIVSGVIKAQLDGEHPLMKLADRIDWEEIQDRLTPLFSRIGRAAKSVRLMVGALILKHMFKLSDEEVTRGLKENLYWRAFCGLADDLKSWSEMTVFDSSTMTRFRQRVGAAGMTQIEAVVREQMLADGTISRKSQFVDTTAMEKNIAHPLDTALLDKGRRRIVRGVKKLRKLGVNVEIRGFSRVAHKQVVLINKLGRGRRSRLRKGTSKLVDYARAVLRQVPKVLRKTKRKADSKTRQQITRVKEQIRQDAELLAKVVDQAEKRMDGVHVKNKVYSLHEPEVVCIAKGKRKKKYEFGSKVSLSVDRNGFVVAHAEYASNIADVHTLPDAVDAWTKACGAPPKELAGDRGYFKKTLAQEYPQIAAIAVPVRGRKKPPEESSRRFRRLQAKRSGVEATISHLKCDHLMGRCRYKGIEGDKMNVSLAALVWNLKRWKPRQERRKAA